MLIPTWLGKKHDIGKYCIVLELTQMVGWQKGQKGFNSPPATCIDSEVSPRIIKVETIFGKIQFEDASLLPERVLHHNPICECNISAVLHVVAGHPHRGHLEHPHRDHRGHPHRDHRGHPHRGHLGHPRGQRDHRWRAAG